MHPPHVCIDDKADESCRLRRYHPIARSAWRARRYFTSPIRPRQPDPFVHAQLSPVLSSSAAQEPHAPVVYLVVQQGTVAEPRPRQNRASPLLPSASGDKGALFPAIANETLLTSLRVVKKSPKKGRTQRDHPSSRLGVPSALSGLQHLSDAALVTSVSAVPTHHCSNPGAARKDLCKSFLLLGNVDATVLHQFYEAATTDPVSTSPMWCGKG